jgi:hypothetical protein
MCVNRFKLLLSPRVWPYSNFCYHHMCDSIQTSVITTCVTPNFCDHHVCYHIQTSVITTCVTPCKHLLSPRVWPHSNFCDHHVCDSTQTSVITTCVTHSNFCDRHVCGTIQNSVITTCVAPFKLLLSPRVWTHSNFCDHHGFDRIQLLTWLHFSVISEEGQNILFNP